MKVTILWLPYMVFGTEGWNRPILKNVIHNMARFALWRRFFVCDDTFAGRCALVRRMAVAVLCLDELVPSGVGVYLVFVDACEFDVEDERGVARNLG